MIGIGIANSIGLNSAAAAPDPAASAYFTATGITGATQQTAIDNLVKGLKQDGLWSKMKAVYPFVTDNRNLLSYSEDFANASWEKTGVIVSTNTTIAPNGTLTADTLQENTSTSEHNIRTLLNGLNASQTYTYSNYVKYNNRRYVLIAVYYNSGSFPVYLAKFDILNGVFVSQSASNGGTIIGASITADNNGWYRISVSGQVGAFTNSIAFQTNLLDDSLSQTYTGTLKSAYIWGAQAELGSNATTYQPIATTQQAFISNQFKYNLVNPVDSDAAFRLVFNGGWTHSANGATPNGTNGYADTKLNVSSTLTLASSHLSFYSRTSSAAGFKTDIGATATNHFRLRLLENVNTAWALITTVPTWAISTSVTNSSGFYLGSRTSNTKLIFQKNSSILSTSTVNETTNLPNAVCYLGALNNSGVVAEYSDRQVAFSSIGDGLTDTEAANLYTRVQAFQNSLNRAVI